MLGTIHSPYFEQPFVRIQNNRAGNISNENLGAVSSFNNGVDAASAAEETTLSFAATALKCDGLKETWLSSLTIDL